jgi:AcrR family transcriptional regulator
VSPRAADPALRQKLLEAAARLIAEEGGKSLSLRRLASEVGASTMAIYTYFGSMEEVRRAVRQEGFIRLDEFLAQVGETGDPVADLAAIGWAYLGNALANPNLYRVMLMEPPVDDADAGSGMASFDHLVSAVVRCISGGRFDRVDARGLAVQIWALEHGLVSLYFAGLVREERLLKELSAGFLNLFKSFGDDARSAGRSIAVARSRRPRGVGP